MKVPQAVRGYQQRYGLYVIYVLYACLALLPPIDCRTVVTLAICFSMYAINLHYGLTSVWYRSSQATRIITKVPFRPLGRLISRIIRTEVL
jgi:hypothetical protein